MNVLVSGSTGMIGSALRPVLAAQGHNVIPLVRETARPGERTWDPAGGKLDAAVFDGVDAVINLAGEPIADSAWTPEKKSRIRESRVKSTELLSRAMALLPTPPRVLISSSAVGVYGDRGNEKLTEDSLPGTGFLAEVAIAWEKATQPAADAGIRVANPRTGIVLSPEGGVLGKMLPLFNLGGGGRLGSGRQWLSWIALEDMVEALCWALTHDDMRGPFNCAAPNPVTNETFSKILARVLGRPSFMAAPAFALRLVLDERADALLLVSQRAEPARLLASGYNFRFPELEPALRHLLSK